MKTIDNQGFLNIKLNFNKGQNDQFVLLHVVYMRACFHIGAFYWAQSLLLTPYLGA